MASHYCSFYSEETGENLPPVFVPSPLFERLGNADCLWNDQPFYIRTADGSDIPVCDKVYIIKDQKACLPMEAEKFDPFEGMEKENGDGEKKE